MYTGVHPFLRRLHIWIGFLILLPTMLIAVTAILLAHDQDLGLKEITLSGRWLPASWLKEHQQPEISAYLVLNATPQNQTALIGSESGLLLFDNATLSPVADMQGVDVRALSHWQGEVFVAARQGVWLSAHGHWRQIYQGDALGIDADADGNLYVTTQKQEVMVSRDGGDHWQEADVVSGFKALTQSNEPHGIELKKLIRQLHSGRKLVGKNNEIMWIDIISGLLIFTSLIGIYRWWKKRNIY